MARRNNIQPIERFPLKPRADGRYQKRIRNQLYYFVGATRNEARAEYDLVKADLYAGRQPRLTAEQSSSIALADLGDQFLDEKEADKDAGRISEGWYADCEAAVRRFLAFKPKGGVKFKAVVWSALRREDLAAYARFLHKRLGAHAYNRERSIIAALFNMADEFGWTGHAIRLGRQFPKRPPGEARTNRRDWLLKAAAIRLLLARAGPQFRAMIMLGLNGGFGPGDCSALRWRHVDLDSGRVQFKRPKNKIDRDFVMWPETVAALLIVRRQRPADEFVFRTAIGNPWTTSSIDHEFDRLCIAAGVALPPGVGFNAFRHTFATYANEIQDRDGYKRIMGRKIAEGIDETYVDAIFLPRLKRIVNHVRQRLDIRKSARPPSARTVPVVA